LAVSGIPADFAQRPLDEDDAAFVPPGLFQKFYGLLVPGKFVGIEACKSAAKGPCYRFGLEHAIEDKRIKSEPVASEETRTNCVGERRIETGNEVTRPALE